jgi:hypothetical protein
MPARASIKIIPSPTFVADIDFSVAGEPDPVSVGFEFRHKSPDVLKEWVSSFGDRDAASALSEVVVRWTGGIVDESGTAVPFTQENFRLFLGAHGPRPQDLLRGYIRELTESRQKN